MNELIDLHNKTYTAKEQETDAKKNFENLKRRVKALNIEFFDDNNETFEKWNLESIYSSNEKDTLCICGRLIKNVNLVNRDNIKCYIGSKCIQRFGTDYLQEKLRQSIRKTVDCKKCGKRISKELEKDLCEKCDIYTECVSCKEKKCLKKYKRKECFSCENKRKYSKCRTCNVIIVKGLNECKECYKKRRYEEWWEQVKDVECLID